MAACPDIEDMTVIHLRPAIAVLHCQLRKACQNIEPRKYPAVGLDGRDILLDFRDKSGIELGLEYIYLLFGAEYLFLIFFQFRSNISLGIHKGLFPYPFRRDLVLVGIADFYIIPEDIVVAYLERRYPRPFALPLLDGQQDLLAVGRNVPQFVQFAVHSGRYHLPFPDSSSRIRMHCPFQHGQKFRTSVQMPCHRIQSLHTLAAAQFHNGSRLIKPPDKLHDLPRSDFAGSRPRYDPFKIPYLPYMLLQLLQRSAVPGKILHYVIPAAEFIQIHDRH